MIMHLVRRSVRSMPQVDEGTLTPIRKQDSTGHDVGPRTSKSSSPSEEPSSMILKGYYGARRFQRLRPIPFQAQSPRRVGRSARGRMKGIQTARMYYRGRPCPRQAKITGKGRRHVARGNPLEDPKRHSKPYGLAIGALVERQPQEKLSPTY